MHFTLYNCSEFERNYLVLMNDQLSDKMNDNNAIIRLMNRFECLDNVEIQFSVPIRSCCLQSNINPGYKLISGTNIFNFFLYIHR